MSYIEGLEKGNVFIFKENDIMILNNLLNDIPPEDGLLILDNIQESVVGEAINKMIGFSVTAMSEMFDQVIAINPPIIERLVPSKTEVLAPSLTGIEGKVLQITFSFKIEELIDSTLIQIIPLDAARKMAQVLLDDLNRSMEISEQETTDTATGAETTPGGGEESEILLTPEKDDPDMVPELTEDGDCLLYTSTIALVTLSIQIHDNKSMINFCFPYITLEKVISNLTAQHWFNEYQKTSYRPSPSEMEGYLTNAEVDIKALLGKTTITMEDFFQLQEGDVLQLNKKEGEPLELFIEDQLVLQGHPSLVEGYNLAIQVTDYVEGKGTVF